MKIMIVDDSALLRGILKQTILDQDIVKNVIEASNGRMAVEKNLSEKPDMIIMDIDMPVMDGISATREIMQQRPVPVMIFSNEVDAANSFRALQYGALDVMRKPDIDQLNNPEFYRQFMERIATLASAVPQTAQARVGEGELEEPAAKGYEMIVMGASTGGPLALGTIIEKLPVDFPLGIVIVQHLETGFDASFAEWLNSGTALNVRLAAENDRPQPGEVLVAPALRHLVFHGQRLAFDDGPKVLNQKPSVDRLFSSAAREFKGRLIGVLLTGMGSDGAQGCVEIKQNGGITLVQDAETSTIFGMPKSAIQQGGASLVLPLGRIADTLIRLTGES